MEPSSIYTFPGKFKITIKADHVSTFVAGRFIFDNEAQINKYLDKQSDTLRVRGFKNCVIDVEQVRIPDTN